MVIVVYDIPNDKRRTKLSKFLEAYGRRVQFSVFECFISLEEMRQLHQKLKKFIVPTEDNVRFYWLFAEAMSMTLTIGSEKPEPPPKFYVI
jgi:CRISPR-associated protein Cas2